jgi:hypothetical protein
MTFDDPAEIDHAPVVLELVIAGTEPLSGTIGLAGSPQRRPFRGWIDLMSVIATLRAGDPDDPAKAG